MRAWGHFAFDNDDAWDWLAALQEVENTANFLVNTFDAVLDLEGEYVDIREASNAIAAAEIVAALLGTPTLLPDTAMQWVEKQSGTPLINSAIVSKAIDAVNQALNDEDSELREA